jgi:hypothetical protein
LQEHSVTNENIAGLPPGHRILRRYSFLASTIPTEANAEDAEDFRQALEATQNRGGRIPGGHDEEAT